MMSAVLLLAALLLAGGPQSESAALATSPEVYDRLVAWITSQGGDVSGVKIENTGGHRRLVAARAFRPGDTLLHIPTSAALPLPCNERPAAADADNSTEADTVIQSAAECARPLLLRMHSDPAFNQTWGAMWAAQPAPGETLSPVLMEAPLRMMLQHPELETLMAGFREGAERVYDGSQYEPPQPPLGQLAPVSLDHFLHVASLVESRYFMPLPAGEDGSPGVPSSLMIPVVEFTNHADSCRDVEGQDDSGGSSGSGADSSGGRSDGGAGGSGGANAGDAAEPAEPACAVASFPKIENSTFVMRALRPIAAGQEVTFDYHQGMLQRPDMTLLIYGFVVPRRRPLLAAVDLPGFRLEAIWERTELDDSGYDDPASGLVTREELGRLQGILAGLPTTEAEDAALLGGGSISDWRQRAILLFRVMRKRALRLTIQRLQAALERQAAGGSADSGCGDAARCDVATVAEEQAVAAGALAAKEGAAAGGVAEPGALQAAPHMEL